MNHVTLHLAYPRAIFPPLPSITTTEDRISLTVFVKRKSVVGSRCWSQEPACRLIEWMIREKERGEHDGLKGVGVGESPTERGGAFSP